jgi:hypothetical protein
VPRKLLRRLVIDADVARSAGGQDAIYPTSKYCRDFLEEVLEICHCVIMSDAIAEEWDRHQSGFARTWRRRMVARKKLFRIRVDADQSLRRMVQLLDTTENNKHEMLNDIHLVEAARKSDNTIVSRDEAARILFERAVTSVKDLKQIIWVNPTTQVEEAVEWLKAGAKPDKRRKLGFTSL